MNLERTTDPVLNPVTDALVEQQLFLGSGESPLVISNAIKSATDFVERDTDRSLITQTWTMTLDRFPVRETIFIPKGKIQSITSLKYLDVDDAEQTLTEGTHFTVTTVGTENRILPIGSWPDTSTDLHDVVTLVWVSGYGLLDTDIPAWAQRAILLKCQEAYDRTDVQDSYEATIAASKLFFEYSINDLNNGLTNVRFTDF